MIFRESEQPNLKLLFIDQIQEGGMVGVGGKPNNSQLLTVESDLGAEIYTFSNEPRVTAPEISRSLRMVGVSRKHLVLRHYVECSPLEVRLQDKVVLENSQGKRIESFPLIELYSYQQGQLQQQLARKSLSFQAKLF